MTWEYFTGYFDGRSCYIKRYKKIYIRFRDKDKIRLGKIKQFLYEENIPSHFGKDSLLYIVNQKEVYIVLKNVYKFSIYPHNIKSAMLKITEQYTLAKDFFENAVQC